MIIEFSTLHFSLNSWKTARRADVFLFSCYYDYDSMKKITIWHFNIITKRPVYFPTITMQLTILKFFQNFANVFINKMPKLILIIVNLNDKLFITDTMSYNNKPSLTASRNERDNCRHEPMVSFDIFTIRHFF